MLSEKGRKVMDFCHQTRLEDMQECIKFASKYFTNAYFRKIKPSNQMEVKQLEILDYDENLIYTYNAYGVEVVPYKLLVGKEGVSKYYYQTHRLGEVGQYINDRKNGVFVQIDDDNSFGTIRFYKNGRLSRRKKEVDSRGSQSTFFMLGYCLDLDFRFLDNIPVSEVKEIWNKAKVSVI